jgi:Acyl-CoA dehydrogenase, C-terminal domain
VDESLQVYGGYGYSKEFPAERACWDARITRIYEGTNEINRLIIPLRLLKDAAMAQLLDSGSAELIRAAQAGSLPPKETVFVAERDLLARCKRLVAFTLKLARDVYADDLSTEQEVLGHIADITIETYALESTLLRTEKMVLARGEQSCETAIDITRVYARDAADRVEHWAKQIVAALADTSDCDALFAEVDHFTRFTTFNTVAARRRIADSIVREGRYYL